MFGCHRIQRGGATAPRNLFLGLLVAAFAPRVTADPTTFWSEPPEVITGFRQNGTGDQLGSSGGPTLAGGLSQVVLTLDLQASTESWMTPEGLPYEDHLEFDARVTGTVTLSPGRAEGDQWVCTEGHYELNTRLLGTATRENWLWHETTTHNFDSVAEFYSAPGPPAPCDARLAVRDGQVDEFFLSLPSSPANENAHVYAVRYSRTNAQAEVWIRLPPPFRYPEQYQVWEILGTLTVANVEGSFAGSVVDSRGQPVPGAQVSFAGTLLTTDANGQFHVNRVAPGPLRVTITKPGFKAYDRTASMPAFLAVSHSFVLEEEELVGSPLGISVVVTNPPAPLLPGSLLPVTLVLSNRSPNVVAGVGTFRLNLAFNDVPSAQDIHLEQLDLAVNLPAAGQQSYDLTLRVPADPSEARGGLGPRRVLARLTAWSGWPDTVSATPWAVSSCFWMGELLVVMTHGFNPMDPWGDDHLTAWEDFRKTSRDILEKMTDLPVAGSAFEHHVRPYVTMWDSSSGFWSAFFSLFLAKYCEAVAWNALTDGDLRTGVVALVCSEVLKLAAVLFSEESRYLAAVSAERVFNELRSGPLRLPPQVYAHYQPVMLIGHSRGAALNARVSNYLRGAGYLVEEFVSLDGYSTDWPDDGGSIGDISIRREAMGRRKWNYQPQEGLSVYFANTLERELAPLGLFFDALALYTSRFLDWPFANWLPAEGVREQMRRFDIRAPSRAAYGFTDMVLNRDLRLRPPASNHLSIQGDYLLSADSLPDIPSYFTRNFLGINSATSLCSPPQYASAIRNLSDGESGMPDDVPPPSRSVEPQSQTPRLIEPWTFDTLAAAEATLRAHALSADADPLLQAIQRTFSTQGRLLNLIYRTTGSVRLGLEGATNGHAILQGPTASLSGRIPWLSSLTQIAFDLRVHGSCRGGRLDLSLGETSLGSWMIESRSQQEDWVTVAVEVGAGLGMSDLTFMYSGADDAGCEVHLDNVQFTFSQPRLRLERHGTGGWRIRVSCPESYTGLVVLEASSSLEDWVPVMLGSPDRGEVEFELPGSMTITSQFWRTRIDF